MGISFYLKINRSEPFAIRNLSRWMDIARLMGRKCYVICDRPDIIERIKSTLWLWDDIEFLPSICNAETAAIVEKVSRGKVWHNAAYAHLSTFLYAKQHHDEWFWNIDADDTWIVLPQHRQVELLRQAEAYAFEHKIDAFSLDMWRTVKKGSYWTFGVTFTKNRQDWKHVFETYGSSTGYESVDNIQIDSFFSYLSTDSPLNIQTFCCENLRFIHYSEDMLKTPVAAGVYHWHDGRLDFPTRQCFGLDEYASFEIYKDVIIFELGVSDAETRNAFTYYTQDINDLAEHSDWEQIVDEGLCRRKCANFLKRHGNAKEIVLFGTGHAMQVNYVKYRKLFDVRYTSDNNKRMWGTQFHGIKCVSLDMLRQMKDIVVVVMIYSRRSCQEVMEQLRDIGIREVDSMERWLRCAE